MTHASFPEPFAVLIAVVCSPLYCSRRGWVRRRVGAWQWRGEGTRRRGGEDSEQTAPLSRRTIWAVSQRKKRREEWEKEIGTLRKGQCGGLLNEKKKKKSQKTKKAQGRCAPTISQFQGFNDNIWHYTSAAWGLTMNRGERQRGGSMKMY